MSDYPQLDVQAQLIATIHTNHGPIQLALFADQAPKTVENFVQHAKEGYYDGVIFHRVIAQFMIQGGDPTGTGAGGESIYGGSFEDEFHPDLFNLRGALSMANAGPNTNGSQFFIVTADDVSDAFLDQMADVGYPEDIIQAYKENGGTPWLDNRHTVFGQVIDGMETVESIEQVDTNAADKPLEDVVIESITIEEK